MSHIYHHDYLDVLERIASALEVANEHHDERNHQLDLIRHSLKNLDTGIVCYTEPNND